MIGPELEPEDVAAMRRESPGDWRRYMRQQITNGKQRRDMPAAVAPPPNPPGHRPGAWPSGTSPPDPRPLLPPATWADALDRFRRGEGSDRDPCGCGACQITDPNPKEN